MRYRLKYKPILLIAAIGLAMIFAAPSMAEDLKAGTVINAKNLDQMKSQTFMGKTIGSMLTEKIEWWIRNHNLELTLKIPEPFPVDPRWVEATKKYAGEVKFDPQTRNVTGYKAGLTFPNITDDDPNKGDKLIWNLYHTGGWPRESFQHIPLFQFLFISGTTGLEQAQTWILERIWMTGNLMGDNPVLGDGSIYYKQLIMALEPFDIRGVGAFKIRYNDGRADDSWVYARSVRRTRRLSGGGWFDPIGGTDELNDEVSIFSPYPNWFPAYKYLGRRTILAPYCPGEGWDTKANTYPHIDLKNAPYWNPKVEWEPREVFMVEATMPDEHIYSKRIYYIDSEAWVPYFSEAYDKKNEFVKMMLTANKIQYGMQGPTDIGLRDPLVYAIDWKRMHCTIAAWGDNWSRNPAMGPDDISVSMTEAIAQGKFQSPVFPPPAIKYEPKYLKDFNLDWSTYKLK